MAQGEIILAGDQRRRSLRTQQQLQTEGFKELPSAFDPAQFRQQVETARGEIAAPSLRSLEQLARRQQIAGRFVNPAVQAFEQGQTLEGFGAGRGQILAGAGQAALGRELPIQQLQQRERQTQLSRLQQLQTEDEARQRGGVADDMAQFNLDLARQRRLEGTMALARERVGTQQPKATATATATKGGLSSAARKTLERAGFNLKNIRQVGSQTVTGR